MDVFIEHYEVESPDIHTIRSASLELDLISFVAFERQNAIVDTVNTLFICEGISEQALLHLDTPNTHAQPQFTPCVSAINKEVEKWMRLGVKEGERIEMQGVNRLQLNEKA